MTLAPDQEKFRADLVESAFLVPLAGAGIYGMGAKFEEIIMALDTLISERGADVEAVRVRFPPLFPFSAFQQTDFAMSFPNLMGAVFTFDGGDKEHAVLLARIRQEEEWRQALVPSDLMLVSAACQPVFAAVGRSVPEGGRYADVLGYCFRQEASDDPMRMRVFRQREFVYIGEPDRAAAHCEEWTGRGLRLLVDLGLEVSAEPANDPFFGRAGRILVSGQRAGQLKTELVLRSGGSPPSLAGLALASVNNHADHFGQRFGIQLPAARAAHSACVGFGLERIALALLRIHGLDPVAWPGPVRCSLCL
jgi:seryl-tRNA synthetase